MWTFSGGPHELIFNEVPIYIWDENYNYENLYLHVPYSTSNCSWERNRQEIVGIGCISCAQGVLPCAHV